MVAELPEMERFTVSKFSSSSSICSTGAISWFMVSSLVPERKLAVTEMLPS